MGNNFKFNNARFTYDFKDFESKIIENNVKLFILIPGGNAFGYIAVQSAYESRRLWLEAVSRQIKEKLYKELPLAEAPPLEGAYLLWINLGKYIEGNKLEGLIKKSVNSL